jgi:hypothetical protein
MHAQTCHAQNLLPKRGVLNECRPCSTSLSDLSCPFADGAAASMASADGAQESLGRSISAAAVPKELPDERVPRRTRRHAVSTERGCIRSSKVGWRLQMASLALLQSPAMAQKSPQLGIILPFTNVGVELAGIQWKQIVCGVKLAQLHVNSGSETIVPGLRSLTANLTRLNSSIYDTGRIACREPNKTEKPCGGQLLTHT